MCHQVQTPVAAALDAPPSDPNAVDSRLEEILRQSIYAAALKKVYEAQQELDHDKVDIMIGRVNQRGLFQGVRLFYDISTKSNSELVSVLDKATDAFLSVVATELETLLGVRGINSGKVVVSNVID